MRSRRFVALYVEQARHIARDGAAHLHRGSLASGRAAGQMRCGGAQEGERGHANVDRRAGDGAVDDEVVAALRAQAVVAVEPGCRDVYDREQGEQPYVGFARCGGHVEGGEERPARDAHEGRGEDAERQHARTRTGVARAPTRLRARAVGTALELFLSRFEHALGHDASLGSLVSVKCVQYTPLGRRGFAWVGVLSIGKRRSIHYSLLRIYRRAYHVG